MKRRHFLSASALAGTWSLLSPYARAAGANGNVRVAVIGFNSRGRGLMDELIKCKNATLVALCDCDSAVLDRTAADVEKRGIKVAKYSDFRKVCEAKDIDAVVIATPNHTHALIAATAAANGKHAYVEKPVSHNVWEGRELAKAAEKHKVVIQSGFQRRSETGWEEAVAWVREGNLGKMTLSRGFCYKPRPSIGKVAAPVAPPSTVDYDLWAGPREMSPIRRKQFHYDWHWQFDYGNGDLGNQGPHQLDVCRWFLGDPKQLPNSVISAGGRLGYDDDGEWANTQIVWLDYGPVPILFEVRGLPKKGVDFKSGMDSFKGQGVGNVIECEGGWLAGGHGASCDAFDKDGKKVKSFKGGQSHMQNFVNAVLQGSIGPLRAVESGHLSSALAHVGNISWKLGADAAPDEARAAFAKNPNAADGFDRMVAHFDANGIDLTKTPMTLGLPLEIDPKAERFTGANAEKANALLKGSYRKGFELPA
jgi:predicted dehydrogenase